jgi:hypothetical protein
MLGGFDFMMDKIVGVLMGWGELGNLLLIVFLFMANAGTIGGGLKISSHKVYSCVCLINLDGVAFFSPMGCYLIAASPVAILEPFIIRSRSL